MTIELLCGDVMERLAGLPPDHFHCVVTSPPYWGQREYLAKGHASKHLELGGEKTPDCLGWATGRECGLCHVCRTVLWAREVRRVLRPDGLLWLNLGEKVVTASGGRRKESCHNPGGRVGPGACLHSSLRDAAAIPLNRPNVTDVRAWGLKSGECAGIPWRIALALQADGWWLLRENVWHKPAPMPSSVNAIRWEKHRVKVGRSNSPKIQLSNMASAGAVGSAATNYPMVPEWRDCPGCPECAPNDGLILRYGSWKTTLAHEHIFMFAKSARYFADREAVSIEAIKGSAGSRFDVGKTGVNGQGRVQPGERAESGRANLRSVWRISPEPFSGQHFACFPTALPDKCIRASTSSKGVCGAMVKKLRLRPNLTEPERRMVYECLGTKALL